MPHHNLGHILDYQLYDLIIYLAIVPKTISYPGSLLRN
jgi:hypothetical protein